MDAPGNMSIAKVTVEYHDPSGVFPLLSDQLQSRLPLRNLHWKSPIRPLRSIESLHVELVKSSDEGSRPSSVQSQGALAGASPAPVKERRHQIPGLRQTPYLKVYLLRCDDADAYKATYRKAVRDWLKSHTHASQSSSSKKNSQENHDAFEWLVLHVVLPNTNAANEPKNTATSASRPDSAAAEKSSKFFGRSSGTLLEKLKADFNVSSKSAPDRVAQIRVCSDDSLSSQSKSEQSEAAQEQNEDWDDVISRLKSLILSSFNLRVSQYEEDIREKDSQRKLPGWNFCTFFVLKEGLARGFESVGLVDDALAGYEELNAELDAIVADTDDSPTGSFLPYTEDLKVLLMHATDSDALTAMGWSAENLPISANRKSFRELILENKISLFDFKCYVFARKIAVLLRKSLASQDVEDLMPLGQLCRHGSWVIPSISRIMRADLAQIVREDPSLGDTATIDNVVASWTYAAAQQILDATQSTFLVQAAPTDAHFSTMLKDKFTPYPSRGSSLSKNDQPVDDAQALFETLKARAAPADNKIQHRSGRDDLAAERAKLLLLQRQIIQEVAGRQSFTVGWSSVHGGIQRRPKDGMSDVSLTDDEKPESENQSLQTLRAGSKSNSRAGIYHQVVFQAASAEEEVRSIYERLTRVTLDHYFTSGQGKGFERMLADLAVLKYQSGDYAGAANYFAKVVSVYSQLQWSLIENEMLIMHGECLKRLNRRDDYVRLLLGLLAKAVARKGSPLLKHLSISSDDFDVESHQIDGQTILAELLAFSAQLPYEITVKMSTYFTNIAVDPHIRHYSDRDGFQLKYKLRHLLEDSIPIDRATVLLTSGADGTARELTLTSDEPFQLRKGTTTVTVNTSATESGWFDVQSLVLHSRKITFVHNFAAEESSQEQPTSVSFRPKRTQIICFPRPDAFDATISVSRSIHIDKSRNLEIQCSSGWNDIENGELKLRSASSGLRLHTADATVIEGDAKIIAKSAPGIIEIAQFKARTSVKISVPYDLEDIHRDIVLRLDVTSSKPVVAFSSIQTVSVDLPLDVNVHDLFKSDQIFSRFHVRSSNGLPLNLLNIQLDGTDSFSVEPPPTSLVPILVLAKQPATFMYKVRQINKGTTSTPIRQISADEKPLILSIDYQCIDEEVICKILAAFESDLEQSDFVLLSRLLTKTLKEGLLHLILPQDYMEIVMVNRITVPSFESLGWSSILSHLPQAISSGLEAWLRAWHTKNETLEMSDKGAGSLSDKTIDPLTRRILITVPIPRLQILQTASLTPSLGPTAIAAVGEPFMATLCLQHTRRWDTPGSLKTTISSSSSKALNFIYEIDAHPDTWLIGGQRRARFTAEEDETKTWTVMLIPLRTGKILLPSVDVRTFGQESEDLTCETEFKSIGSTVLVVGNVRETTLAIKEGMLGPEAVLVDAERY